MNYHEKQIRSFSSSLPSTKPGTTEAEEKKTFAVFSESVMNAPRMTVNDDGSGTASQPKSIIDSRRRSESFATYSGQEYFVSSHSQNSYNDSYLLQFDENQMYYSSDSMQDHGSLFPNSINVDKKIVLYKTEMCRTFEETGICKYGTKCQFAHDPVEVRNIPRHPRYKTEICKTFWQLGNCPYGKRCCFIHTENELKDCKNPMPSVQELSRHMQQQIDSKDVYGPIDAPISDDSPVVGTIHSHNSSRSDSPSKLAEDLKRTIDNIGANSIFRNLRSSDNSENNTIDNLAMLIGSNCSISNTNGSIAPLSSKDPEFKNQDSKSFDSLMTMKDTCSDSNNARMMNSASKFNIFDKSPGSRIGDHDIWTKGTFNSFVSSFQMYPSPSEEPIGEALHNLSNVPSGTASSNSSNSNNQQILIDMLNLLDSAQ
jgi:hypothetical protein